ncbi:hypothetical protein [Paenibacillus sp. BC26]|uniref:hypothetical protein n=1 Tax=Paenibacillus sp. BC26 TaxID=1881032 RepID=UPI0008EDB5A9|nr:hypothetical protein [Paenibacillus sp. BC26]SFS77212.1 hypothetical protein SAMN05428962_2772 [Paenibacillus sp. BC26]
MQNALLTSSFTVVGGLIVFFLSQIMLKYLIEPLSDYRKLRAQVSHQLIYYAYFYANPTEFNDANRQNEKLVTDLNEVSKSFRKLASELIGVINVIPFFSTLSFCRLIPKRADVMEASSHLIGLSNSIWKYSPDNDQLKDNLKSRSEIIRLLQITSIH